MKLHLDTNELFDGAETFPEIITVAVSALVMGVASYAIGAPLVTLLSLIAGHTSALLF